MLTRSATAPYPPACDLPLSLAVIVAAAAAGSAVARAYASCFFFFFFFVFLGTPSPSDARAVNGTDNSSACFTSPEGPACAAGRRAFRIARSPLLRGEAPKSFFNVAINQTKPNYAAREERAAAKQSTGGVRILAPRGRYAARRQLAPQSSRAAQHGP